MSYLDLNHELPVLFGNLAEASTSRAKPGKAALQSWCCDAERTAAASCSPSYTGELNCPSFLRVILLENKVYSSCTDV